MEKGHKKNRSKSILDHINSPADLRGLEVADLEMLAGEIRNLIIETVSRSPGICP